MSNLNHIDLVRQELPATSASIFLNTGTNGPLPQKAVDIMQRWMQNELVEGRVGMANWERMKAVFGTARKAIATLLGADEDEIALTANTTEGMNIITHGLSWQAGDEVITTNHEHPGLLGPLYQVRDRYGVVIKVADLGPDAARSAAEAVAEQLTARTRLISLSHVTWSTGALLDIAEVATLAHEHGIPVAIDGAQSAGAVPLDVHALGIDFYAVPGQKWLCGPDGTGALYVRKESLNLIAPTNVGYPSVKDGSNGNWILHDNACRFEMGGRHPAAVAGQANSVSWLEGTVGLPWLYEHIASLHTYAFQQLQTVPGMQIVTPRPGASGLLSFKLEGSKPEDVVPYLWEKQRISIRSIPDKQTIRISTGFYNTEAEIDLVAQTLKEYQRSH